MGCVVEILVPVIMNYLSLLIANVSPGEVEISILSPSIISSVRQSRMTRTRDFGQGFSMQQNRPFSENIDTSDTNPLLKSLDTRKAPLVLSDRKEAFRLRGQL